MRKIYYVLVIIFLTGMVCAQVGIQTDSPKATLDVVGEPTDVTATDGVIPPRITGDQLQSKTVYGTDQDGTIVYVTAATTTPSGQTINVTNPGLYIFDANQNEWKGINQWTARSVYKTLPASVAAGTDLPSDGLITLDGLLRVGLRTNASGRYMPYFQNISGSPLTITFSSITGGQTEQIRNEVLVNINDGEVQGIEDDDNAWGSSTLTETVTTNVMLPNGSWYEVEWFSYTDAATPPIRHFYMTALRFY